MRSTASSSRMRIAASGSAGAASMTTPRVFIQASRFGACSAPTTGSSSGFSARSSCTEITRLISTANSTGPISVPSTKVLNMVRLSRAFSRTSFQKTVFQGLTARVLLRYQ
jgi:hypothetical protein